MTCLGRRLAHTEHELLHLFAYYEWLINLGAEDKLQLAGRTSSMKLSSGSSSRRKEKTKDSPSETTGRG